MLTRTKKRTNLSFKAILWDFDGCVVDSEVLACQAFAEFASAHGYPISTQTFIDRFTGKGLKEILHIIDQDSGLKLSESFPVEALRLHRERLFEESLQAMSGIEAFLKEHPHLPMCIASGSEPERLSHALVVTRLEGYFSNRVYSASLVSQGKPAPDIFLYAAKQLGVDASQCLVIEDSVSGVTAGKAAGATVFGFLGGSHVVAGHSQKLLAAGADLLFDDLHHLPNLMATWPYK